MENGTGITIDAAVEALVDLDAVSVGASQEYGRGAAEAFAVVLGFKQTADAANALSTLAALRVEDRG